MKEAYIKNVDKVVENSVFPNKELYKFQGENLIVSDGYHTIDELYDHRITLFITLCIWVAKCARMLQQQQNVAFYKREVWRSKKHADGSEYPGYYILGINKKEGMQVTYHIPIERWHETDECAETLETAPEFDGHSSKEVLERLKTL